MHEEARSGAPSPRFRRRVWVSVTGALGMAAASTLIPALLDTAQAAANACSVSYTNASEWAGGFVANVTITNTGTSALSSWTLTFTEGGDQKVTNAWSATVTQSGEAITATNLSYNGAIAAGANTTFGFQGTWTNSDSVPTAFAVNGVACNGGTTTSSSPSASASASKSASPSASASASASASKSASPSASASATPTG